MSTHEDNMSNNSNTSEVEEVNQLELQWKSMELSTFKTQVTALLQQLCALEKATRCQVKPLNKKASMASPSPPRSLRCCVP